MSSKNFSCILALAVVVALGFSGCSDSGDMTAFVYIDSWAGDVSNSYVCDTLVDLGFSVTEGGSASDFSAAVNEGYDLMVLVTQEGGSSGNFSTSDIQDYVDGLGHMIYMTYKSNSDGDYAAIFDASFTGNKNDYSMTLTDSELISNFGSSSVFLSDLSWNVDTTGLNADTGGSVLATFSNGEGAMVLGNGGRTMMLGYALDTPRSADQQPLLEAVVQRIMF